MIRFRLARRDDVNPCVKFVADHPVLRPRYGSTIEQLGTVWGRLLGSDALFSLVSEEVDSGGASRLICAQVASFITDDFAAEFDPFSPAFGTGGSDVDFFRRMTEEGRRFVWCNSAPVYEYVLATRWKRSVLMRRALLRGSNSARHPRHRHRRRSPRAKHRSLRPARHCRRCRPRP